MQIARRLNIFLHTLKISQPKTHPARFNRTNHHTAVSTSTVTSA